MKIVIDYFKLGILLGITCLLSATMLSVTYSVTKECVEKQKVIDVMNSLPIIVPNADNYSEEKEINGIKYFEGLNKKSEVIAYALHGEKQGYQSMIKFMVGIDTKGKVLGLRILEHGETPGLGARITELGNEKTVKQFVEEVFSKDKKTEESAPEPWFTAMFKNKFYKKLYVSKIESDKDAITAITGATITSVAVTDGVKEQVEKFFKLINKR